MTDPVTPNKSLTEPTVGGDSGTWGSLLNADLVNIDSALGGNQAFNLSSASGTVSVSGTFYVGSYPGNTPSYVPLSWTLTGTLTASVVLQIPAGVGGQWTIYNNCTQGSYTITVSAVGGSSSVTLASGAQIVYSDSLGNIRLSATPFIAPGSNNQIIYNSGGSLNGSTNLIFNSSGNNLSMTGSISATSTIRAAIVNINAETASYSAVSSDSGGVITVNSSSATTVTISSSLPSGFRTIVTQLGTGAVTIAGSGVTLNSRTGNFTITLQYGSASILMTSSTTAVIDGAI
jgi:hypothetical protein